MKHRVLITCPNLVNTIEHFRNVFDEQGRGGHEHSPIVAR